jgi:uncharacterized protein DUF4404
MSDLQQTLRALQRELVDARQLDPDERALLETTLTDIRSKLAQPAAASADVAGPAPGDALEGAAVRLEAGHPGLAGALRALVDALSNAGI